MPKKDYKNLKLDPKYVPKKTEEYMSVQQKAYFYNLLNAQREELVSSMESVMNAINLGKKNNAAGTGDEADTANFDIEADMQTRMHERSVNLLKQTDAALARLENGKYGYSAISGEEIGLKRLLARPLATMTLEEREEYEKKKI
ncbi:MAG: TraR/DksA family transcriptional regulator [Rickettsiales bacterium]|jgi:DnaK suppressor protein|nr:TraR/DksA family transcriptional regulator [Rickettsiales bacterium]